MNQSTVLLLCLGGVVLSAIAVIIDRVNFPQRRFRPRSIRIDPRSRRTRDRTGAHVVNSHSQSETQSHDDSHLD